MNLHLVVIISVGCPAFALFYCYIFPLLVDFEQATRTHCHAKNLLPSVSAAISYSPQTSVIWLLFIIVHTPFRFMISKLAYQTYKLVFFKFYNSALPIGESSELTLSRFQEFIRVKRWLYMTLIISRIEIIGLLLLSLFNSKHSYDMHKIGFSTYLIFSTLFTLSVTLIERKLTQLKMPNYYVARKRMALSFTISLLVAMGAFYWHIRTCGNYVYTLFGAAEIWLILTNITFNAWFYFMIRDNENDQDGIVNYLAYNL